MTTNNQLELGFNGNATPCRTHGRRRESRMARGQWWFARMREVVNQGTDAEPETAGRHEQVWMPGARRQLGV